MDSWRYTFEHVTDEEKQCALDWWEEYSAGVIGTLDVLTDMYPQDAINAQDSHEEGGK